MITLPRHVHVALDVPSPISFAELSANEAIGPFTQETFGLSPSEFASAALDASSGAVSYSIGPRVGTASNWKYLEIVQDGSFDCLGVCVPDGGTGVPPTAASRALVGAWFAEPGLLTPDRGIHPHFIEGRRYTLPPYAFAQRVVAEWAAACPLFEGASNPPVWISATQLQTTNASRIHATRLPGLTFQALFIEALSEVKPKWRYLSLYRLFEHGYLVEVFDTLEAAFFANPKHSLGTATTAVESELNQFLSLMRKVGLSHHFDALHDAFEGVKASGNRFAHAIEHSISQSREVGTLPDKASKGVTICYKIRCAIVHAGMSAPIFDAYPDGRACLEALLPSWEAAALHFLGISAA